MSSLIVYKPCAKKCGKCTKCKEFAEVVKQIDLDRTSVSSRQRQMLVESRRDQR